MTEETSEVDSTLDYVAFDRRSSHCLDGQIILHGEHPEACGGHADIWKGQLANRGVAIKVMRPWSSSGKRLKRAKLLRRLWREYLAWSSLSHPNVIEFFGFSYDFCQSSSRVFPSLISPWMSNGTVDSYIERRKTADRLELLIGIANGLSYLHTREPPIVHGDLRAGNVLVSDSGIPCLSDFGLSRVLDGTKQTPTSSGPAGSLRWMSPELFHDDSEVTLHSDVWAFGMTALEVLTGERPYSAYKSDVYVLGQIADGIPPSRPGTTSHQNLLNDELWRLCRLCWSSQPTLRPPMSLTITVLRTYSGHGHRNPPSETPRKRSGQPAMSLRSSVTASTSHTPAARSANDGPSPEFVDTDAMQLLETKMLATQLESSHSESPSPPSESFQSPPGIPSGSGSLVKLADLVGFPEFAHSVGSLIQCYEALEDMKVYKDQCKQLHMRCVELLLDIDRADAPGYQKAIQSAEVIIDKFFNKLRTWSTWDSAKSTRCVSEIRDEWRKLNQDVSRHADHVNNPPIPRFVGVIMGVSPRAPPHSPHIGPHINPYDNDRLISHRLQSLRRYTEIRKGYFRNQEVAIKTIKAFSRLTTQDQAQRVSEKLGIKYRKFTRLGHPNILPYLEFIHHSPPKSEFFASLISPWMDNGTLTSYLKRNIDVDRLGLVIGVASGLSYLHSWGIIHGNVRAKNILVSDLGVPCLNMISVSEIFKREGVCTSANVIESLRWMSPELCSKDIGPDKFSDIWAYGMTIIEIMSGNVPYAEVEGAVQVMRHIRRGETPLRPATAIPDELWNICLRCWTRRERRPHMDKVVSRLQDIDTVAHF